MKDSQWEHLYGPVPSRRLGRSLGIDLVPYKVCTYDCVYCQLGRTTRHTLQRKEYVDSQAILGEIEAWLHEDGEADYLTFSGLGEPTLHSGLGEMIQAVRGRTDLPVVVLTNGSLLWQAEVRAEVCGADLLVPSLDAATPAGFARINRPVEGIEIEQVIEGLRRTREDCAGEMWLEVLLASGYNDSPEELQALREAVEVIQPARVQINTVVRPPAESGLQALSAEELQQAQQALGPRAEIIAPLEARELMAGERERSEAQVRELLRRRPCTLSDLAAGLNMHRNEAVKYVEALLARGEITSSQRGANSFYMLVAEPGTTGERAADESA
jgi:wyosine [tRNA(Phe)-imidazoG37] synthetase (radical SAM superfamily)